MELGSAFKTVERLSDGTVIQQAISDGATLSIQLQARLQGRTQYLGRGSFMGVAQLPWIVVSLSLNGPVEEHFLSAEIASINIRNGARRKDFTFEPDREANYSRWTEGSSSGMTDTISSVRYCQGSVFFPSGSLLYRYAYSDPERQRPLLVSRDGTLADVLTANDVIVWRGDGRWLLHIGSRRVTADRLR